MALESATARIFLAAACIFILSDFFLSNHIAAATSFSFDFSKPSSYSQEDLRFEGNATLNDDLVDLTCTSSSDLFCSGRMSYNHPVPLYDNTTAGDGEVASFVTTFTFSISLLPEANTTLRGDGMAFFLSGYPSRLPPGSYGSVFGLRNWNDTIPTGDDRFVAVEFDPYHNPQFDSSPSSDHIGIDLNSLSSASTARLPRLNGTMVVTVTFDNLTRILEATLQYDAALSLAPATVKTQLPDQLGALLPPVVAVGFSAGTGGYTELHQIHSWSFNSTLAARAETPTGATKVLPGQDEGLDTKETTPGSNGVHPKQGKILGVKGRKNQALAKGGLATLASALLLATWSALSSWQMKQKRQSFGKGSQVKRVEYKDLSTATGKFSDKNKIGAGSSGQVYKGVLRNKQEVAVKKIPKDSQGKFKDFLAELGTIGDRAGHKNVVKIEGWCCSISNFMFWCLDRQNIQLFIVYELVTNGNLHEHLYDRKEVLPWAMRYKIVKGLCSALQYLHHDRPKYILHRDIKPSNILLDDEFNPKLGDFGLPRAAQHNDTTSVRPTQVATRYMDPQCMTDGHANLRRSSDVYSFGIVLLEIAHGKYDAALFQKLHTGRPQTFVEDFADEKLDSQFDKAEMERVIILGLRCSEQDVKKRPSLDAETLRYLEKGGELRAATIHEDEPHSAIAPV